MRTTASPSQRIVSNTVEPPNVIDFLFFPVSPRLFLLALASSGIHFLLATRGEEPVVFFILWGALSAVYLLAVAAVRERSGFWLLLFILATSALFRLGLLLHVPGGAAPSPEAFLHGASPLGTALAVRPGLQRPLATGFDLAALALVPALLKAHSLPAGLALVYGWNPLLVRESSVHGRVDLLPLFFLLLAFLLLSSRRPLGAALAYGASLTGPPFFLATFPVAARALGWNVVLSLVVAGAAWTPLGAAGPALFGWPPASRVGGSLLPAAETLANLFVTREPLAPLWFCLGLWALVAIARAVKPGKTLPRDALLLIGLFLFLSPEALPWAFVSVAGLAAFGGNPGWMVASSTAPLTYLALGGNEWSFWLAFAQYFPVYASLLFVGLGAKGEQRKRPGKAK
jgi:hypothetical protein